MTKERADIHQPRRRVLRPSPRLLGLVGAWLALGVVLHFIAPLPVVWPALGAVLAVIVSVDAWRVMHENPGFDVKRALPAAWPLNAPVTVTLKLRHRARRPLVVLVHDMHPPFIRARHLPCRLSIRPDETAEFQWQAVSVRRGSFRLENCHVAVRSPAGLWWWRDTCRVSTSFRVYPNFNLVAQYGLLAGDRRLEEMGIHLNRRRGTGSEFEQLRDYREGDSMRQIDWAATARTRKLISREYQEDRNQSVVFLLDLSRRLNVMDGELSHFDHCLNALLLLSHVALKQGDEVGLQTVAASNGDERVLPPGRGQRQYAAVLESTFDLAPGTGFPDFSAAAARLMNRQRRRALVIMLTNLRDEDQLELESALALIRQRHLVILADLRERIVGSAGQQIASGTEPSFTASLLEAGRTLYREQRKAATSRLRQQGIIHLDVMPDELPAALVSQYRRLKAGGLI